MADGKPGKTTEQIEAIALDAVKQSKEPEKGIRISGKGWRISLSGAALVSIAGFLGYSVTTGRIEIPGLQAAGGGQPVMIAQADAEAIRKEMGDVEHRVNELETQVGVVSTKVDTLQDGQNRLGKAAEKGQEKAEERGEKQHEMDMKLERILTILERDSP